MRVEVYAHRCHGHGRCYDLAPDVFEPDRRGHVGLIVDGELPVVLEPDAQIGARNCPESALRITGWHPLLTGWSDRLNQLKAM